MKTNKCNEKAIARNIAINLYHNPQKEEQIRKVQDICFHLTSDDGISVDIEMYPRGIVRYLISGTRCSMTLTVREPEHEVIRKPNGLKPWMTDWTHLHVNDILDILDNIKEHHSRIVVEI